MTDFKNHLTKSKIAEQYIQELIVSGVARAGTQITTKSVSDAIGMSETPVREAIKTLSTEGWLRHSAHRGTVVATLKNSQVAEIFQLRGLLNAQAIRLGAANFASERLDLLDQNIADSKKAVKANDYEMFATLNRDFHDLLCDSPEAEWTYRLFRVLQGQAAAFRHGFRAIPDGLQKSLDAHVAIRDALRAGDIDRAADLAMVDETTAGQRLIEVFKEFGDGPTESAAK